MATASDLITAAHGLSTKNNPGKTAASAEMLRALNESFYACYAIAAQVNYLVFAVKELIAHTSNGWPYPECAELVYRIENPAGAEVKLVPYNELDAEPGHPCVYFQGGYYNPTGGTLDPVDTDSLKFFYSKVPRSFASLSATPDTTWRTRHDPLLIADLAMYLDRKDGRADDLAAHAEVRDAALKRYVAWLEHANVMETRSFGPLRFIQSYSVQSLSTLLVGGPSPSAGS